MSTSLTTTTALLFTLLTALTTAAPGADPIADAYAFALAQDRSIPSITKDYNQGSSYGGSGGVDTEAGASGNSGSFKLSNGAIAAIAVVCAVVVIFGIGSAVLFYIAKKRQWEVRRTLKHASRRVTAKVRGKPAPRPAAAEERMSRRKGAVRLQEEYKKERGMPADVEKGGTSIEMREQGSKKEKRGVAIMPPA